MKEKSNSKLRNTLIFIGIVFSLVCLMVNLYLNEILGGMRHIGFENTPTNIVTISYYNSSTNDAEDVLKQLNYPAYNTFGINETEIKSIGNKNVQFIVNTIENLNHNLTIPSCEVLAAVESTKIIYGRNVSNSDKLLQNNVIMIHEIVAVNLYGSKENALNKYIDVKGTYYEIVGILSNTPDILRTFQSYEITSESIMKFNLYTHDYKVNTVDKTLLFYEKAIGIDDLENLNKDITNSKILLTNLEREIYYKNLYTSQTDSIMQLSLNVVIVVTCLVSIVLIIFSVKERAYEIAIRKAIGATDFDVHILVLFDNFKVFLKASIVSIIIAINCFMYISTIVRNITFIYLVKLNFFTITIPLLTMFLCVFLATVIPISILCKKKISECLKVS